jgi:acyl-CoA dehydrogenase
MDFQLSEEQNLIRNMVRSFAEKEVAPSAAERDEKERFDRELMFDKRSTNSVNLVWPG